MDWYLFVLFLILVVLSVIAFEMHTANRKDVVINNYIMGIDGSPKGELTDEEIEEMVDAGVYRPSVEDLADYYNERARDDTIAKFNPYSDKEIQEMLNG